MAIQEINIGISPNDGTGDPLRQALNKVNLNFIELYGYIVISGLFINKPPGSNIPIGYMYFCTDKQTVEGTLNGIPIFYKGTDIWVDSLGRVIS